MAASKHVFQAPKGMRDFFPEDMAVRQHLERAWRSASIRHGFEEIGGPTFEHLDLFTIKSGEGIVSELFSFQRSGGDTDYALRPEFTPTLARMAASKGRSLPLPTKWFAIPDLFRAERPQRGRLREHRQWNVDLLGAPGPDADAEVIAVAVTALRGLGLGPADIRVRISHRGAAAGLLAACGVPGDRMAEAFSLVDRREKVPTEVFATQAAAIGLDEAGVARLDKIAASRLPATTQPTTIAEKHDLPVDAVSELTSLSVELDKRGLLPFCDWDLGIVRGLAYYTGTVWEIHDAAGTFRAVAGGGRYDELVGLFGGPTIPACGFGMGDVVLALLLEDRGLLDADHGVLSPRPDVFVVSSGDDQAEGLFIPLATSLRDAGLHVRHTFKAGRNIGKQLKEASGHLAKFAVILGDELDSGHMVVKDMTAGEQFKVPAGDLAAWLQRRLAGYAADKRSCEH
ncbi:MAG: histidine--tRNA ligase [Planctomycetes bacterium]|nr:histidine--tRNA ligase [Planctomycetota bacterium]MCP4838405.1 histidine--tRNA ligase [Planctomycetota bacterium]